MNLRVSRVSARRSQLRPRSCRGVRNGAICEAGGHRIFMGESTKKLVCPVVGKSSGDIKD